MRTKEEIFKDMDEETFLVMAKLDWKFFTERVLGYKVAPFHEEWINALERFNKICIVAPRGHGKTTILGIAYPLWLIWKSYGKEAMIVSYNYTQSRDVLERIRWTIENNEILSELIPKKGTWAKDEVTTTTHSRIVCKPYTPAIKGLHLDYVLCDEASEYRDHHIFYDVILPTIAKKKGKIAVIGTPVSYADLLAQLSDASKGFWWKRYQAIIKDENGNDKPLWEDAFTLDTLYAMKRSMGALAFERQYMCKPLAMETSLFPPDLIADAFDDNLSFSTTLKGQAFIGADLAIASGGDYSVFTVVDATKENLVIRHIDRFRGLSVKAQIQKLANLARTYEPATVLVDETQFGVSVVQELRLQGVRVFGVDFTPRNRNSMLISLRQAFENKELVIPRKGTMEKTLAEELKNELVNFVVTKTKSGTETYASLAKHDDMVMSLAMAVSHARKYKPKVSFFYAR